MAGAPDPTHDNIAWERNLHETIACGPQTRKTEAIAPHRPPGLVGFFLQEARCPALGLHLPSTTRTRTSPDRARPRNLLLLPATLSRRQSDRLQQAGEALLNGVVAAGDSAPLAQDLGVHEPG